MSNSSENLNDIYEMSKLLSCSTIKLSAYSKIRNHDLLVIYSGTDFVYHNLNVEKPVVKQVPWFKDSVHEPVSVDFSPCGSFLLVLSKLCNLYVVPVYSVFEFNSDYDISLDAHDITIYTYPFSSKPMKPKLQSTVSKSDSNSSTQSNHNLDSDCKNAANSNLCNASNAYFISNKNESKLKEIKIGKCNIIPSCACWWDSLHNSKNIAVIGTKSGEVIFVDLITGTKLAETRVCGNIKKLTVCTNESSKYEFLLLTLENGDQYKLALESIKLTGIPLNKKCFHASEDRDFSEDASSQGNGNALTSRTRLQGLKQMSAEKLASFRHKIAETRSKINVKQGAADDVSSKTKDGPEPENLRLLVGDLLLSRQFYQGQSVLVGVCNRSHSLKVYSTDSETASLHTCKLPGEVDEALLCDRIVYVISEGRKTVQVIPSKSSENWELNSESVLGKWSFGCEAEHANKFESHRAAESDKSKYKKNEEIVLEVYKSTSQYDDGDFIKAYNLEASQEDMPEAPEMENCIVVTNKNIYLIRLKRNSLDLALDLILEKRELNQGEMVCTIFGINLQKLLEFAGDVKLAARDFPTAIAFFKLSKCGILKSIVKLACGSHCSQVLNYSLMLMSGSTSEIPHAERIHLSNLIIMAYTQQILKNENNRNLKEKFKEFLQTNSYFDAVLAVNVTGQSLLFACLHSLMLSKGLILDVYSVLIKLMERLANGKALDWSLNKKEFWDCATEGALVEAMIVKHSSFLVYSNYVSQHLHELDLRHLGRLSAMLDPTAASVRPVAHLFTHTESSGESDEKEELFPFGKLVQLFALTLLAKLKLSREEGDGEKELLLPLKTDIADPWDSLTHVEVPANEDASLIEGTGPVRNLGTGCGRSQFKKKVNSDLDCGFGHTALIRNGTVYTWGQTSAGCLGQGSTMARYAPPAPVSLFDCLKLDVSLVACGKQHTVALTNNGVYSWGCSKYGQLGLGEIRESPHPRLVRDLADASVASLSCGQFHTLAVTRQGLVFAWGWGVHGQLGTGSVDDERRPKCVTALKEHVIVDVAAGHGHSVVLSDRGHVYSFGSGVFGQLGTGSTTKSSLPVLVKGIDGKTTSIATGYFHSLALTESNLLYTWGSSPQCLRFQAQARKRSRLTQNQGSALAASEFESLKSPTEECIQRPPDESETISTADKAQAEAHLSPSPVDISHVSGKIVQVSCGCHHSALVTDSGGVYTWGRSLDGQLGNGAHRDVSAPAQINANGFKAECVSAGCEFTVALEKRTGKVFCWGSNSVGQLGVPVKESASKSLDGKLVMLKSCKRIVRLLERNASSNSVDVPKEMSDIPGPSFVYRTLSKHLAANASRNLARYDPGYSQRSLHFVVEKYRRSINLNFILKKSLEYGNYQLAAKISLLQNNYKQSIVYRLKALQNFSRYRKNCSPYFENQERSEGGEESPDSETTEKGPQGIRETARTPSGKAAPSSGKTEYANDARRILSEYLDLDSADGRSNRSSLVEVAIQFWTAEKLPMTSLESFFYDNINDLFYELALFLFCQRREDQTGLLGAFSTSFLLFLATSFLNLVKSEGICVEYLDAMSQILAGESAAGKTHGKEAASESSTRLLESIENDLRGRGPNGNRYVRIDYGDVLSENVYFFTCGHSHSSKSLEDGFRQEGEHEAPWTSGLKEIYASLTETGQGADVGCPVCVQSHLRQLF